MNSRWRTVLSSDEWLLSTLRPGTIDSVLLGHVIPGVWVQSDLRTISELLSYSTSSRYFSVGKFGLNVSSAKAIRHSPKNSSKEVHHPKGLKVHPKDSKRVRPMSNGSTNSLQSFAKQIELNDQIDFFMCRIVLRWFWLRTSEVVLRLPFWYHCSAALLAC